MFRWSAPLPTPNLEGRARVFCPRFPSPSHRLWLFEGAKYSPFAIVAQLLATGDYDNEDVRHMSLMEEAILDGRAFPSIYEESVSDSS